MTLGKKKEFPSENEKEILIEVIISENDMPRLIGKSGKVINLYIFVYVL